MLILFLVLPILTLSREIYEMNIDYLFQSNQFYYVYLDNCPLIKKGEFYYRGKPAVFERIKDKEDNNKYNSYSSVYFGKDIDSLNKDILKFPKNTIFILDGNDNNNVYFEKYKDYCFITGNFYTNVFTSNNYYIIISTSNDLLEKCLTLFLVILSIFLAFFILLYNCKCFPVTFIRLYVSILTNKYLICSFLLALSNLLINYIFFFSICYSFYKTFIIIHLIYLLTRYQILYFIQNIKKKILLTIILFFIELIASGFFLLIIYFIPSLDNFYLYFIKSLIEHITILVVLIIMFIRNFIRLYKQYRVERRIRTILTLTYKYKLLVYTKVFIFSLFYSLGFIIMNIIQISYHINYYIYGEKYVYYMNIALELFFIIILGVIFYPMRNSLLYYINVHYDYYSINFISEIKKNKEYNMNIQCLNKQLLKEEYFKNEYPLVLIEPFTKTNKVFYNMQMHIGVIKKG